MKTWLIRGAWATLAAVAGLSTWLFLANRAQRPTAAVARSKNRPDYSLRNAQVTRFGKTGARQFVLKAARIVHMPTDGSSLLTDITLDYYPGQGSPWRLNARHGRLAADGNQLQLAGNVRARELVAPNPVHFATTRVEIFLHTHRLHTKAKVTLWQTGRETRGIGMVADLRAGTLSLLKDVTSRYAY